MASEYEKKLVNMQYQMKENQAYLTDYFKDLENWTSEVKKKEDLLKKSSDPDQKVLDLILLCLFRVWMGQLGVCVAARIAADKTTGASAEKETEEEIGPEQREKNGKNKGLRLQEMGQVQRCM